MKTSGSSVGLKLISSALLLSAAGVAFAGGAVPAAPESHAIYAEVGGGFYHRNLQGNSVVGAKARNTDWDQGRIGGQVGLDVGYRFWKYLAGEVGYFWMQEQKTTFNKTTTYVTTSFAKGGNISFKSWAIYMAARANFEVALDWDVYAKLGVAYLRTDVDYRPNSSAAQEGSGSLWSPLFGVGISYEFSKNWSLGLDYAIFIGNTADNDPFFSNKLTSSSVHVPPLQRVTVNIGYSFEL